MEEEFIVNAQQSISAAFDSVNLINETITKPTDDENKDSVKRNVEHLELQVVKDWYVSDSVSRTAPASKAAIQSAITAGKAYLA